MQELKNEIFALIQENNSARQLYYIKTLLKEFRGDYDEQHANNQRQSIRLQMLRLKQNSKRNRNRSRQDD